MNQGDILKLVLKACPESYIFIRSNPDYESMMWNLKKPIWGIWFLKKMRVHPLWQTHLVMKWMSHISHIDHKLKAAIDNLCALIDQANPDLFDDVGQEGYVPQRDAILRPLREQKFDEYNVCIFNAIIFLMENPSGQVTAVWRLLKDFDIDWDLKLSTPTQFEVEMVGYHIFSEMRDYHRLSLKHLIEKLVGMYEDIDVYDYEYFQPGRYCFVELIDAIRWSFENGHSLSEQDRLHLQYPLVVIDVVEYELDHVDCLVRVKPEMVNARVFSLPMRILSSVE